MFGVKAWNVYVPRYRLSRDVIAAATGAGSRGGERAVANYDEDCLTMAVEAGSGCNGSAETAQIDALLFASTSSPYREKQAAAFIARVLELPEGVFTVDLGDTLRCGTQALRVAWDAVKAGSARSALVVASEQRLAEPRSELEQNFGDGAAALLLGSEGVAATVEHYVSRSQEFVDLWRTEEDRFVKTGEARFVQSFGYERILLESVAQVLKSTGLSAKDFRKIILPSPDGRSHIGIAKKLGFDPETQVQDPLFREIGDCGSAHPFLLLAAVLDEAGPGDRILLASYGDGCDTVILQATPEIESARRGGIKVKDQLARKAPLGSYEKYLRFRDLFGQSTYMPFSSLALLWREQRQNLNLIGSRCRSCGAISFPMKRVCDRCGAMDDTEEFSLARRGKVYTYVRDHIFVCPDSPLVLAAVDMEAGGRFFGQVTDCDPKEIGIGTDVGLTLRRLHDGLEFHHYFWKCRPTAGEKAES